MTLAVITVATTALGLSMRFTPPIYRMFRGSRVWHTREYLDQEEFLQRNRADGLVWWEGFL